MDRRERSCPATYTSPEPSRAKAFNSAPGSRVDQRKAEPCGFIAQLKLLGSPGIMRAPGSMLTVESCGNWPDAVVPVTYAVPSGLTRSALIRFSTGAKYVA